MIEFSSVLPKTRLIALALGGNNLSSRSLEALASAILKIPDFLLVNFFSRFPSKAIPARDVQHFLKQLLHHSNFSKILINDCTFDTEFKKFGEEFNKERQELGFKIGYNRTLQGCSSI